MNGLVPIVASDCSCKHDPHCACVCHGRACDPGEHICHADFLPDEGGLAPWGCPRCTPGGLLPHAESCAAWAPASRLPTAAIADAAAGTAGGPIAFR